MKLRTIILRTLGGLLLAALAVVDQPVLAEDAVDYDALLKKCEGGTGCCKASVERMKQTKAILQSDNKCPQGYTPNTLKCITSYAWCEPFTGRCTALNREGKCVQWQQPPVKQ